LREISHSDEYPPQKMAIFFISSIFREITRKPKELSFQKQKLFKPKMLN